MGIRRVAACCGIALWSYRHHRPSPMPLFEQPTEQDLDLTDLPSIGLVTPTFENGQFLRGAIESVVSQGYPNLHYAVCDGGSTDNSAAVLNEFDSHLSCWTSTNDNGQGDAINRGFSMLEESGINPEVMGWLNADDRHLPWTLHAVGKFFRENPEVDVVYGNRLICDADGGVVGRWLLPPHRSAALLWRDYIPQETMFWRRRIWERVGGQIDESYSFAMDWDLVVRFAQAGANMAHLPMFLGTFTAHEGQKSASLKSTIGAREFARIRQQLMRHTDNDVFGSSILRSLRLRLGSIVYILHAAIYEWMWRLGARKVFGMRSS